MNQQVSKNIRGRMTNKTATENVVAEVAIKFAEFIEKNNYVLCDDGWAKTVDDKSKTSEELFEEFVNNHLTI